MEESVLQFTCAQDLWKFKMKIEASDVKINLDSKTMFSRFKNEEIELAINEYKAHVRGGINNALLPFDLIKPKEE